VNVFENVGVNTLPKTYSAKANIFLIGIFVPFDKNRPIKPANIVEKHQ
jgi:hypothetical protein